MRFHFVSRYHRSFVVAASRACQRSNPGIPLTPALVHNHTIARAREAPFVCLILQWLRLVDITLAILDSARVGERGDYPTYFHMALLMLSFLAVTNAHHYILITDGAIGAALEVLGAEKPFGSKKKAKATTLAAERKKWLSKNLNSSLPGVPVKPAVRNLKSAVDHVLTTFSGVKSMSSEAPPVLEASSAFQGHGHGISNNFDYYEHEDALGLLTEYQTRHFGAAAAFGSCEFAK